MENNQTDPRVEDAIILIMRSSNERTHIATRLAERARVFCFHTKDDILNFLKDTDRAASVKMFIADFSDLEIDAWGILEPVRIIKRDTPMFFITSPNDTHFYQMVGKGIAGTFARPFNVPSITAIIFDELAQPTKFNRQPELIKIDTTGVTPPALHLVKDYGDKNLKDLYFGKIPEEEYGETYLLKLDGYLFEGLKSLGLLPRSPTAQTYKSVDLTARLIHEIQELDKKYRPLFEELEETKKPVRSSAKI